MLIIDTKYLTLQKNEKKVYTIKFIGLDENIYDLVLVPHLLYDLQGTLMQVIYKIISKGNYNYQKV